jgi:signal transduction histidine kinase
VAGGLTAAVIGSSDFVDYPDLVAVMALLVGWGFIGVGLLAWGYRPENRLGTLMTATGFAFFVSMAGVSDLPLVFLIGNVFGSLFMATAVHLLLAAPSGRLESAGDRRLVTLAYLLVTVFLLPVFFFTDPKEDFNCAECPENLILLSNNDTALDLIGLAINVVAIALVIGVLVSLVKRWRRAAPPERRLFAPFYASGVVLMATLVVVVGLSAAIGGKGDGKGALDIAAIVATVPLAAVPYLFLYSLVRARMFQGGAVRELVGRVSQAPRPGELRDALAEALEDPTVDLVYRLPDDRRWVDGEGRTIELPAEGSGRAATRVEREGECIAAIVHDATLADDGAHVNAVGAAALLSIQNERLDAELRAKVEELRESRRRMLRIGLEERRRLERDLHDGAQQRLVSMSLNLRLARARLPQDPDAADQLLAGAGEELDAALDELRELARGIHPALLSDRGLDTALQTLVHRAPVPVTLRSDAGERLPEAVELAAYFVVSEALTNVVKYAHASQATVELARGNGRLLVEVADDGVGGADPARGTGLRGLADRLAVLEGRLELESAPGRGTTVRARIPCE